MFVIQSEAMNPTRSAGTHDQPDTLERDGARVFDMDSCKVLVLLGASGSGKSTTAEAIGQRLGRSWLQVDDLRLALQFSGLLRQAPEDELNMFFAPDVWTRPTGELVLALVRVATLMEPALRIVIHSHVVTNSPIIFEGDGIHPRLARDPLLRPLVGNGTIRFCCLSTPTRDDIYWNMISRNRGIDGLPERTLIAQAETYGAFGAWLEHQSRRAGIPVVPSAARESLPARVLDAISR